MFGKRNCCTFERIRDADVNQLTPFAGYLKVTTLSSIYIHEPNQSCSKETVTLLNGSGKQQLFWALNNDLTICYIYS